ncbi:Protein of unknown function [Gryllus bimaculatus]|nr:Protein of unknown function [Gryllus bimaculatus]
MSSTREDEEPAKIGDIVNDLHYKMVPYHKSHCQRQTLVNQKYDQKYFAGQLLVPHCQKLHDTLKSNLSRGGFKQENDPVHHGQQLRKSSRRPVT